MSRLRVQTQPPSDPKAQVDSRASEGMEMDRPKGVTTAQHAWEHSAGRLVTPLFSERAESGG